MPTGRSWLAWDKAHLALSRMEVDAAEPSLSGALERTARLAVRMLQVDRVGVWLVDHAARQLSCIYQFDREPGAPEIRVLGEVDLAAYLAAMDEHRFIVADDARVHPFTRELREHYLEPLGITSMLDAPIFRGQELVGVVCHESRGAKRSWSTDERYFAGSVGDVVALFMEQHARLALETELRIKEAALQRAERLNGVARLAAGVAHDFNNLLTVVSSLAERGASTSPTADCRAAFQEIHDTSARAAQLAERLLRFGRGVPLSTRPSSPNAVVQGVFRLLRSVARETTLRLDLQAEDSAVLVDAVQLEQVLVNLVTNAVEAGSKNVTVRTRREDGSVVLEVEDDGEGMSAEVQRQIFEPLFTTKESGTGLGLPTVVSLAESTGGRVTVQSAEGRGTTVRVYLRATA